MAIRIRVYPQYSSWGGWGPSLGISSSWGVDRAMRRRMRMQQRQIARDQQLFSLHLLRQQVAMQRQMVRWNASSAMHANAWSQQMALGLGSPYGLGLASPYVHPLQLGLPTSMLQATWGGAHIW